MVGTGRLGARPAALDALDRFSARIGRDIEQVQAAGGNTSLKLDGVLYVKASGLWLADAPVRDVFVPVRLDPVREAIAADAADPVTAAVVGERNPEGLRPSIETTLHALLPHPVVVHTHSVRTIALAVCADAEARLVSRLDGLAWAFVPYCKPGLPLTQAVAQRLQRGACDVLVLGNHGLVVGAESVDAAARLLAEVERRLDVPVRATDGTVVEFGSWAQREGLRPAIHPKAHRTALDPRLVEIASGGSLYPDHVIFLGPASAVLPGGDDGAAIARAREKGQKLFLVPGKGVLLADDADRSADELAACLALVLERLSADARCRYLTHEDEAALMNWDAEAHRKELARARDASA